MSGRREQNSGRVMSGRQEQNSSSSDRGDEPCWSGNEVVLCMRARVRVHACVCVYTRVCVCKTQVARFIGLLYWPNIIIILFEFNMLVPKLSFN